MKRKRLLFLLALLVLIPVLAACAEEEPQATPSPEPPVETVEPAPEPEPEEEEEPEPEMTEYQIGETASFEQFEITVGDFEITERFETSSFYFTPDEGNQFVVVDLTVANIGTENQVLLRTATTANDTRATIVHESGDTFNIINVHSGRNLLGTRIAAGEADEGFIIFEISQSAAEAGELGLMFHNAGTGSLVFYLLRGDGTD